MVHKKAIESRPVKKEEGSWSAKKNKQAGPQKSMGKLVNKEKRGKLLHGKVASWSVKQERQAGL